MFFDKILETRKTLLQQKKIPTEEQLAAGQRLFREKFNPEKLGTLDGKALLDLFNFGNRESLIYWLEFKNDEEFQTGIYGSILGGSSHKFVIYLSSTGIWISGSAHKPVELTEEEALEKARIIRDNLVKGAEIIENLLGGEQATESQYIQLQQELEKALDFNMANLGWVHKYYHLIFPDKIDDLHKKDLQRQTLVKLHIRPASPEGLYSMAGQVMGISRRLGIHVHHLTRAVDYLYKVKSPYIRLNLTSGLEQIWDEMYSEGYVAMGWPELGDLSDLKSMKRSQIRAEIKKRLEEKTGQSPQVINKWTRQAAAFLIHLNKGAIVVAVKGDEVLGAGKIISDYRYVPDKEFPHLYETEWLHTRHQKLPNPAEGKKSYIYTIKDPDNLLQIEKWLSQKQKRREAPLKSPADKLTPLSGVAGKIERILKRKKQVILYGPPGTGKTYHAEKTCKELSARQLYNKCYDRLTAEEKQVIEGTEHERGTVRMCTFHPSYGYEDFIEGIKPRIINNTTVFELKNGIFKTMCKDAVSNPDKNYYLIIDEINRGDISRIFGELITLIEKNKRDTEVILPLSGEIFSVPKNVFIVGTMNTADRSIALLDVALRRRFGFIELLPDYQLLEGVSIKNLPLALWLKELNLRIIEYLGQDGRNLQIGHSYFLEDEKPIVSPAKFVQVIEEDVIPLVEEYCYGDYSLLAKIMGSGLFDLKNRTVREELFEEENIDMFINALLDPTPELSTITVADEEDREEEDPEESLDDENENKYA